MYNVLTVRGGKADNIEVDTADSIGGTMDKMKEIKQSHGFCGEKDEVRVYHESGGRVVYCVSANDSTGETKTELTVPTTEKPTLKQDARMDRLHHVEASILATREHCKDKQWLGWAEAWLDNSDRSWRSAYQAYQKAEKAYYEVGEIDVVDSKGDPIQALSLVAQAAMHTALIAHWQTGLSEGMIQNSETETDRVINEASRLVREALECASRLMATEKP